MLRSYPVPNLFHFSVTTAVIPGPCERWRSTPILLIYLPLLVQALSIRGIEQDSTACNSYEKCSSKGLQIWNILHSNLSSPKPYIREDTSATFNMYYQAEPQPYQLEDFEMKQDFEEHHFDTQHLDVWTIVSKDPAVPSLLEDIDDPPYTNVFDTNQGIIIADANFRFLDTEQKLSWSEIIYNLWKLAMEEADHQHSLDKTYPQSKPISNLQYIVQHLVVNADAQTIVELAYQRSGYKFNDGSAEAGVWRVWTEEDLNTRYWFYALLGTENVKGTLWLLNDHSVEIGKKEITKIWTRWSVFAPDFWIEIGPSTA
ncbi:MAG: hypothetical protein Q9218_007820 [Villophora microphyllina]